MTADVTVNRHVLVALTRLAEAGQMARADRCHTLDLEAKASDLRDSARAWGFLSQRIDKGTIADVSISNALDHILTA